LINYPYKFNRIQVGNKALEYREKDQHYNFRHHIQNKILEKVVKEKLREIPIQATQFLHKTRFAVQIQGFNLMVATKD
jgi:hypothetical protein